MLGGMLPEVLPWAWITDWIMDYLSRWHPSI